MDAANWAGNYRYRARVVHRPTTVEQLQELVSRATRVRVLGSRHSFTGIADSDELVTLEAMPADVVVDRDARTVTVGGAVRYGELADRLRDEGLALGNLASLPHISVAGAVATATHGSGDHNGNLATAVAAVELVTSAGEVVTARRGESDFDGLVVGLGATGAVTRVTLDVEPAYDIRQRVFEGLEWATLFEQFEEVFSIGYSVSAFTRWTETIDQVWVKSRVTDEPEAVREQMFGAQAATVDRHPIIGLDPVNATPQLGVPGQWADRLPHFRMGFTPSSGEEIQSEYLVARHDAVPAIEELRKLSETLSPLVQVTEFRTIAADRLWMSPEYGRESVGIHFTWQPDQQEVEGALAQVEAALAPFEPRPHWGKLFLADADTIAPRYPRLRDFAALLTRLDPRGAFRNDWLAQHVLGRTSAP
jgi:alditol oxidase